MPFANECILYKNNIFQVILTYINFFVHLFRKEKVRTCKEKEHENKLVSSDFKFEFLKLKVKQFP